ncbi:hypothetical protein AM493_14575 [Flavobacterium akiainvivens]|uniref:Deoxyuridine 5'-triphosphate nucleotidohydrolase n=1 Tax=Flavobacterium akiainvivens TaxID=1202724 RepID=A0A0M8MJK3_9FLAO|nr:DUF4292 domain-containing protein [Flavobacterium akiainvivens]KOS07127.1 hypothetical protein AM493_14575 [Flavobacterium akiainvivens]SFQ75890.1 protein of unknown function [Flavobacterium akiainvivens]
MKKVYVAIAAMGLLVSCKSKQAVIAESAASGDKAATEIIDGHYSKQVDFNTLVIRADARYKDSHENQGFTAEVRIKKDEKILVMVRYFGMTMAKGLITPTEVVYYEQLGKTYFSGDYRMLSRWLGTDLDYTKVQNMLLGEAMDNLKKGTYKASVHDGLYRLQGKEGNTVKEFLFEGANFLIKKQAFTQGGQQPRSIEINYPAHGNFDGRTLPAQIKIEAEQQDRVSLDLEYKSVKFDEKITFPFEVPDGFTQVFIEKD